MTLRLADPLHEIAAEDVRRLVNIHTRGMEPLMVLAVAANLIGKMIALQDKNTSPQLAMEVVSLNITHGNKQMLDEMARIRQGRQ